jgi:hypothetical protein
MFHLDAAQHRYNMRGLGMQIGPALIHQYNLGISLTYKISVIYR